jgi:hypothetical protein
MATGKRYYWIKIRDTFMTSDTVDFLMGQKDGANYIVLYQMLCLKTINTEGRLARQIGEIIIPFDIEKIQRDCKWFSVDTIRIAMNLYKALGLIYEDIDGTLVLTDHHKMVGTETDWAEKKRNQRALSVDNVPALVPGDVKENVPIDIRDKRLEIRDKRLDIRDKNTGTDRRSASSRPTLDEVREYCKERGNAVDPEKWFNYYESNGWRVGKNPMRDWRACVRTWEKNGYDTGRGSQAKTNPALQYQTSNIPDDTFGDDFFVKLN